MVLAFLVVVWASTGPCSGTCSEAAFRLVAVLLVEGRGDGVVAGTCWVACSTGACPVDPVLSGKEPISSTCWTGYCVGLAVLGFGAVRLVVHLVVWEDVVCGAEGEEKTELLVLGLRTGGASVRLAKVLKRLLGSRSLGLTISVG